MAQGEAQNYTLGRGEVYFARFVDEDTYYAPKERYIGNTPEFSLTIEQEVLDHFSSDRGIREKDESISLQVNRSGSLTTDNINTENVALFFFGSAALVNEAGEVVAGEVVGAGTGENGVEQGMYYQLGVSEDRPAGAKGLVNSTTDSNSTGVVVAEEDSNSAGGTPFTEGTDYEMDYDLGRLYIKPGGGIVDGTVLTVGYTIKASTYSRVISGSQPVAGALRFLAVNPTGDNIDYYFPWVKISPNGDYALKSDEWQTIPWTIEILKRTDREAIYADGRPAFA